jgi:hypothetical protein
MDRYWRFLTMRSTPAVWALKTSKMTTGSRSRVTKPALKFTLIASCAAVPPVIATGASPSNS